MTKNPFVLNWSCLRDSEPPTIAQKQPSVPRQTTQKTFAQVLNTVCDIPLSQLPKPSLKGNKTAISIPDEEYSKGLETCKHNLHARVVWPKGATPLTAVALREKLRPLWKTLDRWGVTSIGKGYFEFSFSSLEDARSVRTIGSWNLNPGLLKLFAWTHDFKPSAQKNTSAQVWLRIHGLGQEYWRPKILFAIASSVGSPICTDSITSKPMFERTFGHFARVLVDIDLSVELIYRVLVERIGYAFFVDFEYEKLPDFCTKCNIIGHDDRNCRKLNGIEEGKKEKNKENIEGRNRREGKEPVKENAWVKKNIVENTDKEVVNVEKENEVNLVENGEKNNTDVVENDEQLADNRVQLNHETNGSKEINESEINAEIGNNDDTDSQASEFVDATQLNEDDNESSTNDSQQDIPQRIQNDMSFLHDSWSNLADLEQKEINKKNAAELEARRREAELIIDAALQKEDDVNIEAASFQMVTNRKKKIKKLVLQLQKVPT